MKAEAHSVPGDDHGRPLNWGLAGPQFTPKQREQQARRQCALQMRSEGKTLQEIADELGWSSPSGVSYALKRARKELNEVAPVENAQELRRINNERLDALLVRAWPLAVGYTTKEGVRVPPDRKWIGVVQRIIDDKNKLMGVYDLPPAGGHDGSASQPFAAEPAGPEPILTLYFDEERRQAAMAQSAHNEPISVDDQPPAGYIAPRPGDVDDEPETVEMEPNSVDPVTGEPIFDPRAALKSD